MFRRLIHTQTSKNIAFAFDIDGVLLRGGNPIDKAGKALRILNENRIPYVLLTNGGGTLEYERTQFISNKLQVQISPLQIIQSHTPFKTLSSKFDKILAVGTPTVRKVAENYGFKDVVHPNDIVRYNQDITPFSGLSQEQLSKLTKPIDNLDTTPFEAVLVFNDPKNWAGDLQIISDLLNSERGMLNTMRQSPSSTPSIPIYFSNDDLLWANPYKLNRFGQGAFRSLVHKLYEAMNPGQKLSDFILGKPTKLTYDFAHHVLIDWNHKLQSHSENDELYDIHSNVKQILPPLGQECSIEKSPFQDNVFMVGDNPASDITGAQNYGWKSCLVKTGVYRDGDDLKHLKPTMIVDDVYEAVTNALEKYA
ncbi:hypothetical protein MOUN0_A04852 [Monosporozyma unispora]|nr:hypothetical protein C6P44_004612 [Kazachstania unispora]